LASYTKSISELMTSAAPTNILPVTRSPKTAQPRMTAMTGLTKVYVATIDAAPRSSSQT
jgi:hypothetical protein